MKQCPHCHEESFGWRELISLDYFSSIECKACGQLVRNDGVRLFLTFPAILGAVFVGGILLSSPRLDGSAWLLSIPLLIGFRGSCWRNHQPETQRRLPSFTPDIITTK
jgi:hypothetical protein